MGRLRIFRFIKHKKINLNRKREEFNNEKDWLVYKCKRREAFARIKAAEHRRKMEKDPIYRQKDSDWWLEVNRKREEIYERWEHQVRVNNKISSKELKLDGVKDAK